MQYKQIRVDSLLTEIKTNDKLFGGDYTVDPYQNCEFGCLYCDSSFDKTIYIKLNAPEILKKELNNLDRGTIIVGSVHDPYQKAEEHYKLTRKILSIIQKSGFSCHILTKSELILRDIDILKKIPNSYVTISITSLNNSIIKTLENNISDALIRLQTINKLSNLGIKTGIAIMPIIPYICESELNKIIKLAKDYKAQYILHKHLELKGDQKLCFFNALRKFNPKLVEKYKKLYRASYKPDKKYISKIDKNVYELCTKYKIKNGI